MPWKDPEKNAEAVRRWRSRNPGYWRRYDRASRAYYATISRYKALDEDLKQQEALYRLSRRQADRPDVYRQRERRWIQATDFWSSDAVEPDSQKRRDDDDG